MENIMLENVELVFRNFSGRTSDYNPLGKREVSVKLNEQVAADLQARGLNVKSRQPRDEDDDVMYHLPVAVRYGSPVRDPEVVLITQKGRQTMTEQTVGSLDYMEIINCDVNINPSTWEMNGKTGIKAYLTSAYITVHLDPLALKYADVPELGGQTPEEPEGVQFR